ncbi:phosphotransferase family protein [Streptomyces sp. NPDC006879]|uniref:phosphotransferase family protein n=1 Tax=Streptomyces sp. NPDC006879 TaxID=3364767 RepID=UPI0036A2DD7F
MTAALADQLAALAASALPHPHRAAASAPAAVLADRADGTVVAVGGVVAKAHAPDTDLPALAVRLRVASSPLLTGVLLPPLLLTTDQAARARAGGRAVSLWPQGSPVDPEDPEAAPWEEVARLLARLHTTAPDVLPASLPPMRGPVKVDRALRRLDRACPPTRGPGASMPAVAAAVIRAAAATLPAWAKGGAPQPSRHRALCHGDLHLGQLVRHPAPDGPWLLIDVDDLGAGDPAWDLARPAAWFAAGLLGADVWTRFLDAYRAAGGPAAGAAGDPWPRLDVAARALTVQAAALAVAKSVAEERLLDEVEQLMVDSCTRVATLRTGGEEPSPA